MHMDATDHSGVNFMNIQTHSVAKLPHLFHKGQKNVMFELLLIFLNYYVNVKQFSFSATKDTEQF